MDKPYQRKGSKSNAEVGNNFEAIAKQVFFQQGILLTSPFKLPIGIKSKKQHNFDLGNEENKIIIECKSHCWTENDNVPSAKITTWDQAMFFFFVAPPNYRKVLFVLRDYSLKRKQTLAEYYIRLKSNLIPPDVEIWEYDIEVHEANKLL